MGYLHRGLFFTVQKLHSEFLLNRFRFQLILLIHNLDWLFLQPIISGLVNSECTVAIFTVSSPSVQVFVFSGRARNVVDSFMQSTFLSLLFLRKNSLEKSVCALVTNLIGGLSRFFSQGLDIGSLCLGHA